MGAALRAIVLGSIGLVVGATGARLSYRALRRADLLPADPRADIKQVPYGLGFVLGMGGIAVIGAMTLLGGLVVLVAKLVT